MNINKAVVRLREKSLLTAKKIYHFSELTSTNNICCEFIEQNMDEGVVVSSDLQTRGRGRFKREWISSKDLGLYFSILLKPKIDINQIPLITSVAALAISKVIIKSTDLKPLIKWPNDVLVHGKKISGILAEVKHDSIILGIGVNVNHVEDDYPESIRPKSTSLRIETGKAFDRDVLLEDLLSTFEKLYLDLIAGRSGNILDEVKKLSATLGNYIRVENSGQITEGIASDLDQYGSLIIECADGKMKTESTGEVINICQQEELEAL